NITTFIYNPQQPIATIKRHLIVVPENAEFESGFPFWLSRIWNIALNTGSPLVFYAPKSTIKLLKKIHLKHPIAIEFEIFNDWFEFGILSKELNEDDNLIIVLSRKDLLSYQEGMDEVPNYLNNYFKETNFLLVYPSQSTFTLDGTVDLTNPSLLHAIEKLDVIGKTVASIFRKK